MIAKGWPPRGEASCTARRHELLARTGLSLHKHRRVAPRRAIEPAEQLAHRDAAPDERAEAIEPPELDRLGDRVVADDQLGVPEPGARAVVKAGRPHPNAVHVRAVPAAEVGQPDPVGLLLELGVDARDARIRDDQVAFGGRAGDHETFQPSLVLSVPVAPRGARPLPGRAREVGDNVPLVTVLTSGSECWRREPTMRSIDAPSGSARRPRRIRGAIAAAP